MTSFRILVRDSYAIKSIERDQALAHSVAIFSVFLSVLFGSIDLYAAIRRSVAAAKISLCVFAFGMGVLLLSGSLMAFVYIFGDEETKSKLPPLDGYIALAISLMCIINAIYGWSLFVLYRDNKGLARNKWGRLVPAESDVKVASTEAGPIHLP
ncbi:hypothetical protein BGZ76_011922 [Entomortierella beljakovae]|nr:hypothetical protein BGZ76_011922 [Entomortierella beljakovae]